MKTILKFLWCFAVLFFVCVQLSSQMPQITTLEDLEDVVRPFAREQFDKNNLFVFDGPEGANQCHINALMVAFMALQRLTFDQLRSNEQLFLIHDVLRSRALGLIGDRPHQLLREWLEKNFKVTLSSKMMRALRSIRGNPICEAILKTKAAFFDEHLSPLVGGCLWRDVAIHVDGTTPLPKFVGIWVLTEFLATEQCLWMIIRAKNAVDGTTRVFAVAPNQRDMFELGTPGTAFLEEHIPVVVIEAAVSSFDFTSIDPQSIQLANAASWLMLNQLEFFTQQAFAFVPELFPDCFRDMLDLARDKKIGPGFEQPLFSIQHMHPDTVGNIIRTTEGLLWQK